MYRGFFFFSQDSDKHILKKCKYKTTFNLNIWTLINIYNHSDKLQGIKLPSLVYLPLITEWEHRVMVCHILPNWSPSPEDITPLQEKAGLRSFTQNYIYRIVNYMNTQTT